MIPGADIELGDDFEYLRSVLESVPNCRERYIDNNCVPYVTYCTHHSQEVCI